MLTPSNAPRAGELTTGWRNVTIVGWVLVLAAYLGVLKASKEIGLATWWLGPGGDPQPFYVVMVPFLAPAVVVMAAASRMRGVPLIGLGAASIAVVVAIADIDKVPDLAGVELVIAAAGALISIASFPGRYRPAQVVSVRVEGLDVATGG